MYKPKHLPSREVFLCDEELLYDNLGARCSLAGEAASLDLAEANNAVFFSVDGEVAAHVRAWASLLGLTNLTNEDFTCADFLATKALHAKSLTG